MGGLARNTSIPSQQNAGLAGFSRSPLRWTESDDVRDSSPFSAAIAVVVGSRMRAAIRDNRIGLRRCDVAAEFSWLESSAQPVQAEIGADGKTIHGVICNGTPRRATADDLIDFRPMKKSFFDFSK
jgi:hypothetical protein